MHPNTENSIATTEELHLNLLFLTSFISPGNQAFEEANP